MRTYSTFFLLLMNLVLHKNIRKTDAYSTVLIPPPPTTTTTIHVKVSYNHRDIFPLQATTDDDDNDDFEHSRSRHNDLRRNYDTTTQDDEDDEEEDEAIFHTEPTSIHNLFLDDNDELHYINKDDVEAPPQPATSATSNEKLSSSSSTTSSTSSSSSSTTTINNNSNSNSNNIPTKAKWKKKRYLMMQDVQKLIEQNDSHAIKKAEEIIIRMNKLSQIHNNDPNLKPNEQVYNLLIHAISKCMKNSNAGQKAEEVLDEMRNNNLKPNIISYTSVMDAYAQCSNRRNKIAAQEAERVLSNLIDEHSDDIKISSITCDTVIKAWVNRGDVEGAKRAQSILQKLQGIQKIKDNTNNNIKKNKNKKNNDNDDNDEEEPLLSVHSYGLVIHAWATCNGGTTAAENAELVLQDLIQPNSKIKADTVVFNSAINAWANSRDPQAGTRSERLMEQMRKLHNPQLGFYTEPDSVTYNTVLAAWSHIDDVSAATETERVLKGMQEAYRKSPTTSPPPTTACFNSVLHAWSRSSIPGSVKRAQDVLEFMIKSNKKSISPDVISFTCVLNALAKSKETDKAIRAKKLLDTMLQMYDISKRPTLKPSQIPFNAVMNACAFSATDTTDKQKAEALQVAITTFSELRARTRPDTVSYGNLMKCFHNLVPPGERRNDMAMKLFNQCIKGGLVGELVWTEVRRTVQSRVLNRALNLKGGPPSSLFVTDLPRSWTNRVQGDKLAARRYQAQAKKLLAKDEAYLQKKRAPVQQLRSISEASYRSGKDT